MRRFPSDPNRPAPAVEEDRQEAPRHPSDKMRRRPSDKALRKPADKQE